METVEAGVIDLVWRIRRSRGRARLPTPFILKHKQNTFDTLFLFVLCCKQYKFLARRLCVSKRRFMNIHSRSVDSWLEKYGHDTVLQPYFAKFYELTETRAAHAAHVRAADVAYAAKEITKAAYHQAKQAHESYLKGIKSRLRKEFDFIQCGILLRGIDCCCYICGQKLDITEQFNRDHVFPRIMGFRLSGNMMPAHYECNQGKDKRLPHIAEIELARHAYAYADLPFNPYARPVPKPAVELMDSIGMISTMPAHLQKNYVTEHNDNCVSQ